MTDDWKRRFNEPGRPESPGSCPSAEQLSLWVTRPLTDDAVAHLAACALCRGDLVAIRRALPARRPATRLVWIAAAAAIVIAVLAFIVLQPREPERVVVVPPKPKPVAPAPRIEAPPPAPEVPKPAPKTETPPPPPPPAPAPEPPVVAKPIPAPEKPAPPAVVPVPEKPAPEPTRAALKGTLASIAGSCSTQAEGDAAAQSLKPGQKREFPGAFRVKTDTAAAKVALGPVTYYVQRTTELLVQLQEGRTHVQLVRGEAFFDVVPGSGLFEVDGAAGKVVVKGTRFLVSETEVLVQRGAVEWQNNTVTAKPKADLAKRLAWVRALEDYVWIEAEQMALQGGMALQADATASGGRAIGVKDPLKPGAEAAAEIRAKRKQPTPYTVWLRISWPHNVPSALSLSVGDALRWTSKDVVSQPGWQWVKAGTGDLPDDAFRVRLTDTKVGLRVDQILITSDADFNPEVDKR